MAITQLTPSGIPGQRYGSFAGKDASNEPAGPHNPGTITQLTPSGIPGQRYGSFAGKSASDEPVVVVPTQIQVGDGGPSWEDFVTAEFRRKHLLDELYKQEKKLKKVEKQLKKVEEKLPESKHPEGILANIQKLAFQRGEIEHRIEQIRMEMLPIEAFLEAEIDDDDEEVMGIFH